MRAEPKARVGEQALAQAVDAETMAFGQGFEGCAIEHEQLAAITGAVPAVEIGEDGGDQWWLVGGYLWVGGCVRMLLGRPLTRSGCWPVGRCLGTWSYRRWR